MPPRHGKSELISKYFPAFYLSAFPKRQVALVSYEADFASQWGRKAREVMEQWGHIFGLQVRDDSSAASRWEIAKHGGGMVTTGIGGPLTGRGAHMLIIDDPVKNAEEAQSKKIRKRNWDWWQSTGHTRLEPGGVAILVMTRWDAADLAGRIMDHERDRWDILELPAFANEKDALGRLPAEALWPERFPADVLEATRSSIGSYWFSAEYQQSPAPREGGRFKREWFQMVAGSPDAGDVVRYWDFASTPEGDNPDPDWTVGAKVRLHDDMFWAEDIVRFRGSAYEVEVAVKKTAERDGRETHIVIEEEPGSSGKSVISNYSRMLRDYVVKPDKVTGSKELRADLTAAKLEAGTLVLQRASWNEELIDEHVQFNHGAHDDQVDALSGAVQYLADRKRGRTLHFRH